MARRFLESPAVDPLHGPRMWTASGRFSGNQRRPEQANRMAAAEIGQER